MSGRRQRLRRLPWEARYVYGEKMASEARRLALLATNTHADVRIAKPVRIGPGFRLFMPEGGTFIAHPGCDFRRGFVCEIFGGGRVEIGPGSIFTSNALVQITTRLTIGPRAVFAQSVLIVDGNHRWRDPDVHPLEQGYDYTPIDIGAGALVLSKVTIFSSIGERAVVGANAVVNRPIPPYCLAAGTPARVREYYGHPADRPDDLDLP